MKEEIMDIIDFIEVKEEILDYKQDTDYEKGSIPTEENVESPCTSSHVSCRNYPIVYTTRLEEMHIFKKDLNNLPPHIIINYVIAESKPKVRQCIDNIKQNGSSVSRFLKLLRTLQQYNYMVSKACSNSSELGKKTVSIKTESQEESKCRDINKIQELIDLCKPLTVKLIDCKKLLKSSSSDEIGKCRKLQNACALNFNNKVFKETSKVKDNFNFNTHVSSLYEAFTNVLLQKNAEYKRSLELYSCIGRATHHPPHNKPSNQNVMPSITNKDEAINNTKQRKQTITSKIESKRNALNDNSSNKKARRNTTSSQAKHVAVQTSDTVPQQQAEPIVLNNIFNTNTLKSTNNTKKQSNTKTTTKRKCQKMNALSDNLSDKPARLNTSFVSSRASNVTVQTSCIVPQEHAIPMEPSNAPPYNLFSTAVNQPHCNYQYLNAMAQVISLSGPVTSNILPVLLPIDNGNTNSIVTSVPQNGSLLQFVPSSTLPVPEDLSSKIPQASDISLLNDLAIKNDDDGCILGI